MVKPNRKPDIICIGAQKAGTSWFHEVFGQRRDIWVPPLKELHFFDSKFLPECLWWTEGHIHRGIELAKLTRIRSQGAVSPEMWTYLEVLGRKPLFNGQWYKHAFSIAPKHARCMDVTPEYSMLPLEGVEFVNKYLPQKAQYIYIIREPVSRALSHLAMKSAKQKKLPANEAEWLAAARDPMLRLKAVYSEYVPRWQHVVGDRLLIIPYSDLVKSPAKFLRKVETFLNVPAYDYVEPDRIVKLVPKVEIPVAVTDFLSEALKDQVDYYKEELGMPVA